MNKMKRLLAAIAVILFSLIIGSDCFAQAGGSRFVTVKGIAKVVPDRPGAKTSHLEIAVSNVTYRLQSDMIGQDDLRAMDGSQMTASGDLRNTPDKVKVLEVMSFSYEKRQTEAKSSGASTPSSLMLGNWNVYFADGRLCDSNLRIFHPDGRFEVTGLPQWNGRYEFTNPDQTQLKISCNNGRVLVLDYKKDTDSMVENTGVVFRRAKKQDASAFQSLAAGRSPSASTARPAAGATWYELSAGEKYVTDFILSPGITKSVTIPSRKPLKVGFKTNGTMEQEKKYGMTATRPLTGIKMEQPATHDSIESVLGGGTDLTPKNGRIDLKFSNRTGDALKVVVYFENE